MGTVSKLCQKTWYCPENEIAVERGSWYYLYYRHTKKLDKIFADIEATGRQKKFFNILKQTGVDLEKIRSRKEAITVRQIRLIQAAMLDYPDPFTLVAAVSEDKTRIVFKDGEWKADNSLLHRLMGYFATSGLCAENTESVREVLRELYDRYGLQKVNEVAGSYKIDFKKMMDSGTTLTAGHIRKMLIGLNTLEMNDLFSLQCRLQKLDSIIGASQRNDLFCGRERDHIETLFTEEDLKIIQESKPLTELPADIFNKLVACLQPSKEDWDCVFAGSQAHHFITGLGSSFIHSFFYSLYQNDRDLLQLTPHIQEDNQEHYLELLAKVLIKKTLINQDLQLGGSWRLGRLVPAVDRDGQAQWYRVAGFINTGEAKFAYHLVPATSNYDAEMPDILLYRSSATGPAHMDSVSSWVTDSNPFAPPGYLEANTANEQEKFILHSDSKRKLIVAGHSLGGSQIQLMIMNHYVHSEGDLPPREVDAEIFDSPCIKKQDAQEFKNWIDNLPEPIRLKVAYHCSALDWVAQCGEVHLGYNADDNPNVDIQAYLLRLTDQAEGPQCELHPHHRHFYDGVEGETFTKTPIKISDRDDQPLRALWDTTRRTLGLVIFPLSYLTMKSKRFLIGRRGDASGLTYLIRRFSDQQEFEDILVHPLEYLWNGELPDPFVD